MKSDREELFTTASVGKAVFALVAPTVISQLITVVYNMADTFFVGQLNDPKQVAATAVSMPVFMFLTGIANLFGLGGSSLISRCLGSGKQEKAKHVAVFCIWSAFFIALVYGILILILQPVIFPLIGANKDIWNYCQQYIFWTVGIGAVPTVMNSLLAHLIRSEGYSKEASFGVAFGGILNMVLDPLFIFTFGMEIEGAAIATMISNLAATLYLLLFIYSKRKKTAIVANPKLFTFREKIPGEVIAVGLPSFMMTIMATFSNTSLNKIVASYSNEAIAGMGIAKKIDYLAFAIAQGMTQGALPLIAYNYASGNKERMNKVITTALISSLVVAGLSTVLLYTCAVPVARFFINDATTVSFGQKFLKIICLACTTTSLNFMIITIFQAVGRKIQPFILSLLRKGGFDVILMVLFNHLAGVNGVAWATPVADSLALLVALGLFLPYRKKMLLA